MKKNSSLGFSLTELSITLVIIGMIIAAIAGGTHMLEAARINKVISELAGYKKAVENFRLKYNAWPGDMANAVDFWGTFHATNNPEGTVNGNGNEQISNFLTEQLRAWQQLARSGMIKGHYTGVDAGTPDFVRGVNLPGSDYNRTAHYVVAHTGATTYFGTTGTYLSFAANENDTSPEGAAITAADALVIDKKSDDGQPTTGELYFFRGLALNGTAGRCVSNPISSASATVLTTDGLISCRMFLWLERD